MDAVLNRYARGFSRNLHGEAAYIHELRAQMLKWSRAGRAHYVKAEHQAIVSDTRRRPVAHCMTCIAAIKSITSSRTPGRGRAEFRAKLSTIPVEQNEKWNCGDFNTHHQLMSGKTMMVQWEKPRRDRIRVTIICRRAARSAASRSHRSDTRAKFARSRGGILPNGDRTTSWWIPLEPGVCYDNPMWKESQYAKRRPTGHGYILLGACRMSLRQADGSASVGRRAWSAITPLRELQRAGQPPRKSFPLHARKWQSTTPIAIEE